MAVDQESSVPHLAPKKAELAGLSLLMTLPRRVLSVARFEFRRSITPARLAVWSVLALFPVAIMGIVSFYDAPPEPFAWGIMFYGLVPQVVCLLGLLLWVAPVVHSELEGRTWFYLTSRPGGRVAMLLGKYLNGVAWCAAAGCLGVTLAMIVAGVGIHDSFTSARDKQDPWR